MLDILDIVNTPTSSAELDVEGDEDRHPDDEPETDQEFVRVRRYEEEEEEEEEPWDDEEGETAEGDAARNASGWRQVWAWVGDPLDATFDTAQDAMAAADDYFGEALDWWEEEDDVWFAHRPFPFPPECHRDPDLDDNDRGTVAHA
jgi:hypothetical protein